MSIQAPFRALLSGALARSAAAGLAGTLAFGCASGTQTGREAGDGPGQSPTVSPTGTFTGPAPAGVAPGSAPLGATAIPRLSRAEYIASVRALLGVDLSADIQALPLDALAPFDNMTEFQAPSAALIQGLGVLAELAAERALATPESRAAAVGCAPTGASDLNCFRQFVESFGKRALHRPLTAGEVADFDSFLSIAQQQNDFYVAVAAVIRALLQDLEFVYRVEIGIGPVSGVADTVGLSSWEIGARLSYLFWGETPDDVLLQAAEAGTLNSSEGMRAQAERLLADARGIQRVQRFHALWLGYEEIMHAPQLRPSLRAETDALVRRVVFENGAPWPELFTASETYLDAPLAETYGMPAPAAGAGWVAYTDPLRRGLLSHGTLLGNGAKNGDTSPTLRGKFILEALLCSPVPPPPPGVNSDAPPPAAGGDDCKADRYALHSTSPDCAGCHSTMDPVGFGLENFDMVGRYRESDAGKPQCAISGVGALPGAGPFRGPAELGQLLTGSEKLVPCLAKHLYEFALQRHSLAEDAAARADLERQLALRQFSLRDTLLDWVGSGVFRFRKILPYGT